MYLEVNSSQMLQNILTWQRNPTFGVNDTYMLSTALSYGLELS